MDPLENYYRQMTRRSFFRKTATGIGGLALGSLMNASAAPAPRDLLQRGALGAGHLAPKAKRIIYLFQNGAPSQLDLFDYKPKLADLFDQDLPDSIRGEQRITGMTSGQERFPIAPSIFKFSKYRNQMDGLWVSELYPHTASMAHGIGADHTEAGRLWTAGATTGEVRAYDAGTGELLEAYPFEAGFLNDVAVTPEAVYISDSFVPQIAVVPIGDDGALVAPDEAFVVPITGDLQYGEGFNANGIVATPAGLVLVHSGLGQLFLVDPATGASTLIDTGEADLTAGDGLELVGQTVYVMRNRMGEIVAVELDEQATTGVVTGTATSDDFDVPTTVAAVGDDLWVVNARFGTDATPETAYWMSRVDAPTPTDG